jgi:hypothetical protein
MHVASRLRRLGGALAATTVALIALVVGAPAHAATSQSVYPTGMAIDRAGASVPSSSLHGDKGPANLGVVAGTSVALGGGLTNYSASAQTVSVTFSVECYDAASKTIDVSTPALPVTVPGDPATFKGLTPLKKVSGTLTVPKTCVHHAAGDGYFAFTVKFGTNGAAQDILLTVGAKIPGPGLPAVGAAGSVVLYRAIDAQEFDALAANGNRYSLARGQIGKYFFPTKAQAQALATQYESLGYGDYVVTSTSISDAVLATAADSIAVAGEGDAYFILEAGITALAEAVLV